jgi:dihydrodipicolinate synthase/N-acetylneuraminate lyase
MPDYHALRGILPTVLTPYDAEERVDTAALNAQVRYLVEAGVHGLVLMGSIGESPYLCDVDRAVVIRTAVEAAGVSVPVAVGITADSTVVAADQVRQARELGACAAIVCLPQYFKLQFADVKQHYARLSGLKLLPILYYHYPAATRLELKPDQIAELLSIPNVVGIKESTFDMLSVKRHIELTRELDCVYLSGSELNFVQFMRLGGHGAISAGSLLMPRTAVAMYAAYEAGDTAKASQLQAELFETMPLMKHTTASVALVRPAFLLALKHGLEVPLGIESTQARLKAALARRGVPIQPVVRTPLAQLTPRDEQAAEQAMKKIEQIEPTNER